MTGAFSRVRYSLLNGSNVFDKNTINTVPTVAVEKVPTGHKDSSGFPVELLFV